MGDGEMAAQLPGSPTALAGADYLRSAVPADMFATITDGRIDLGMPPFGPASSDPLADADRWNTIAAVYSLGTTAETVANGQEIYKARCQACHGETGRGDGPEAAGLDTPPGDLTAADYWATTGNQAIHDLLAGDAIASHDINLADEEGWAVVDFVRTLGYAYTDAQVLFEPLATAVVSGQVVNATTGEMVGPDAPVRLRAFTRDLEITLNLTTTLDALGNYQFALTDVPQDWFYRVAVEHEGIEFGSDFGQLTFAAPALDLPVTVYDTTSDPAAIAIQQLHTIVTFDTEGQLTVSELYVVRNDGQHVFVGETGDVAQGTFEIAVPPEAESLDFQRGFGSLESFIPANEVVETERGWADTLPLRPGVGALTLLVRYVVPYEDEASLAHPVFYAVDGANLVLPDNGVTLAEEGDWVGSGEQSVQGEAFQSYGRVNVPAGGEIVLELEGRPRAGDSAAALVADNNTELAVGLGAALLMGLVAVVALRRWRGAPAVAMSRDELLEAVAELDDAYAAGELDEQAYRRERSALLDELRAEWGAGE
jgi:hypothetical protein